MAQRQAGPLFRRVASAVGVEVLLALAVAWAMVGLPPLGGAVDVLVAVGVALLLLFLPAVDLLLRQRTIVADGLPGFRRRRRRPSRRAVRIGAGAGLLLTVASIQFGLHRPALLIVLLADLALAALTAELLIRLQGAARERVLLSAAVSSYAPRFVVYSARDNNASYQLEMWLPQLEKLGVPYLMVVRHPDAVAYARSVTTSPVVCCPSGPDLDAVVVPSLRAAFYVNGIAENANFVVYRQLRHVYLGHGDSDKELSVHPMHAMFDRIFVAGQAAVDRYGPAGVDISPDKFVIVGRPQLAGLREPNRPATPRGEAPRVLFAPTWRGYNARTTLSSLPVGLQIVEALLTAGVVVSFRPHPFSWLGSEREHIDAIDAMLRADRAGIGRPHRLAEESRGSDLLDDFDASDALVSDVGSVLVDYFATDKPYAAVLPTGTSAQAARRLFPSTTAAYLVSRDATAAMPRNGTGWVAELLNGDPLADRRAEVRRRYLGDQPRDDRPFLAAACEVLGLPEPADSTMSAPTPQPPASLPQSVEESPSSHDESRTH